MTAPIVIKGAVPEFSGVSVRLPGGHTVLVPDVLFDAPCTILMGSSGCGKSTALKVLGGYLKHTSGTVTRHDGRTSYVMQQFGLLDEVSVMQNILIAQSLAGIRPDRRAAETLLGAVGLGEERIHNSRPEAISVGQQQRAAIARALAVGADFLLLDEPSSGLHKTDRSKLIDLLQTVILPKTRMVIATHDEHLCEIPHKLVEFTR